MNEPNERQDSSTLTLERTHLRGLWRVAPLALILLLAVAGWAIYVTVDRALHRSVADHLRALLASRVSALEQRVDALRDTVDSWPPARR